MGTEASKGRTLVAAAVLGFGGYAFANVLFAAVAAVIIVAGVPLMEQPALQLGLSVVLGQGVAFGAFALVYLRYTGRGLDFIRARVPTLRDLGWSVGGTVALFTGLVVLSATFSALGLESASNVVEQFGEEDPRVFLLLVPLSFLLIGPGEELLYRGVVQGRLREMFGPAIAIGVASAIFASVHVFSLQGTGVIVTLTILFVLSLILGAVYEVTENIVVPSLIHGAFNAIQFYGAYVAATGGLEMLLS